MHKAQLPKGRKLLFFLSLGLFHPTTWRNVQLMPAQSPRFLLVCRYIWSCLHSLSVAIRSEESNSTAVSKYCVIVPSVGDNPCGDMSNNFSSVIVQSSCIARNASLVASINLCEKSVSNSSQYNTQVVFDETGVVMFFLSILLLGVVSLEPSTRHFFWHPVHTTVLTLAIGCCCVSKNSRVFPWLLWWTLPHRSCFLPFFFWSTLWNLHLLRHSVRAARCKLLNSALRKFPRKLRRERQ